MKSMEASVTEKKVNLRRFYLKQRTSQDENEAAEKSKVICEKITHLPEYEKAECIFAYMPVKGEVDIRPVIEAGLSSGKCVALPKCLDQNGKMAFYAIKSMDDLVSGEFGILEPGEGCPLVEVKNGIMLVPGVAFDIDNRNRLGYGKGYYDSYVGASKNVCYVAPAYDFQILRGIHVPTEEHDKKVDIIVSEEMVV